MTTTSHDSGRGRDDRPDGAPTVAEIAALTARLRDLSNRGGAVSETERNAFLADKDALLARIPPADDGWDRAGSSGVEVPAMPEWMREQAARTQAEMAAATASRQPDDPVVLAERVGELRAAEGASRAEEVVDRADAVDRLAAVGYDRGSAEAMVTEYLHETSRAVGVPVYQWGLDQYDVDDIARTYAWVDRDSGETLAEARERAAMSADVWTARADPSYRGLHHHLAGGGDAARQQAELWAARARVPEPFTHDDQQAGDVDATDYADEDADVDEDELGSAWTDFYTDDEITAMGDALDAGDVWEARRRLRAYHAAQRDRTDDDHVDRPPEAAGERGRDDADEDDRREQLTRWHADDSTADRDAARGDGDALERGDQP